MESTGNIEEVFSIQQKILLSKKLQEVTWVTQAIRKVLYLLHEGHAD
jgi:hypothetical protein